MVDSNFRKDLTHGLVRSPFQGHAEGERPTRTGVVGVQLAARTLGRAMLVSTWPAGIHAMTDALGIALGVAVAELPSQTGQTHQCVSGLLMRVGPEEFFLVSDQVGDDMMAMLRAQVTGDVGSVTNLSHARCRIRISGVNCLDALGKLIALDFRPSSFPVGEIRLSGHHHVPCTLHRLGLAEFDLYVFSTYAFDQLATLLDAALEYGVGLSRIE